MGRLVALAAFVALAASIHPVAAATPMEKLVEAINRVITAAEVVGLITCGVMAAYAGYLYKTAEAEPLKTLKTKKILKGILKGVSLIAFAEIIKSMVLYYFPPP